jgi:hypothetical protein
MISVFYHSLLSGLDGLPGNLDNKNWNSKNINLGLPGERVSLWFLCNFQKSILFMKLNIQILKNNRFWTAFGKL